MSRILCAAVAVLIFTATRTSAHHAFAAEYDENKVVAVSGMVTKFEWTNPHALLYVDGNDAEGKRESWMFEMGSPGGLERRGWKRTDLKNGDQVTVDGSRAKDGSNSANTQKVVLPGVRRVFDGSSAPDAP